MLLLHDLSRSLLSVVAQRGLPQHLSSCSIAIAVAGSPYEEAVRYGQAIRRPLIAEDGEELLIEAGFNSCVYLPLLAGGTVVGVISMYGDETLRERVDVPALMTMGSQLGLAIANVRLYQDTRTERLQAHRRDQQHRRGRGAVRPRGPAGAGEPVGDGAALGRAHPAEQPLSEMPDFYAIRDLEGETLPVERLPLARALSGEVFHDYRAAEPRRQRPWIPC